MGATPECPRCGYDQTGHIETWNLECPLVGVCSECGLEFEWREILNPRFQIRPGFIEHADSIWRCLRWSAVTFAWILVPWVFWRRVRLHHRHEPRRRVLFVLLFAIIAPLALLFSTGVQAYWFGAYESTYRMGPWQNATYEMFMPLLTRNWRVTTAGFFYGMRIDVEKALLAVVFVFVPHLAWPILLLALPVSMRRARVRSAHVARAVLYPFVLLLIPVLIRTIGRVLISVDTPNVWGGSGVWHERGIALYAVAGLCFVAWVLWLPVWWLCTLRLGWRLDKAWSVWFLLMISVFLCTFLGLLGVVIIEAMVA